MSKNIVICMDGTWNDPSEQTNVYKLFRALKAGNTVAQDATLTTGGHLRRENEALLAFYLEGVGASGRQENVLDGAIGTGLHARVLHAYTLASSAYQPGDKFWIFGFSRGAWSARSLAGLITRVGLMSVPDADGEDADFIANRLWLESKSRNGGKRGDQFWHDTVEPPIRLVGVWDTVGALGIPFFNGIKLFDRAEKDLLDFADLTLGPRVEHGRHALAIDERRLDFAPTLWEPRENIRQVWFAGAHADVGGGYPHQGLSDIALEWMGEQVVGIEPGFPISLAALDPPGAPDFMQHRHDETQKPIWRLRIRDRSIAADAELHPSVMERLQKVEGYRPAPLRKLKALQHISDWTASGADVMPLGAAVPAHHLEINQSKNDLVNAAYCWNAMELEVREGEQYRIVASGEWWDDQYRASAAGYLSPNFLMRAAEVTRRVADAAWFCLSAAVHASPVLESHNPTAGNVVTGLFQSLTKLVHSTDEKSQLAPIGIDGAIQVTRNGFLYLFANDSAFAYANNRGTLQVTVTRVS